MAIFNLIINHYMMKLGDFEAQIAACSQSEILRQDVRNHFYAGTEGPETAVDDITAIRFANRLAMLFSEIVYSVGQDSSSITHAQRRERMADLRNRLTQFLADKNLDTKQFEG